MQNSRQLLKTFLRDITDKNNINQALMQYLKDEKPLDELKKEDEIPFSSDRKYSACVYNDITLILGAPETLLEDSTKELEQVRLYAAESYRVLAFGYIKGSYKKNDNDIKKKFKLLAIVALDDPIREEAPKTLEELSKENIQYRIISGDSPETVLAIARRINKKYPANVITGEELNKLDEKAKEKAILNHNIFARIDPHQKQRIIRTLKRNNNFVVMIGDGVNDILALRESDLSVAMNGGSTMAKDVADIVLLNNSFSTLPILLYEGRKIIANIQTIANIYLIKNISAISVILLLGFIGLFPFDPRHIMISSFIVIGIPSFVLAFDKHKFKTSDEGFIKKLLIFSGIVGFGNSIIYTILYSYFFLNSGQTLYTRSVLLTTIIFLGINNIILIYLQHYSFAEIIRRKIVAGLIIFMFFCFILSITVPSVREAFGISRLNTIDFLISLCFSLVGAIVLIIILRTFRLIGIKKTEY